MKIFTHQAAAYQELLSRAQTFYAGHWRNLPIKTRWHSLVVGPTGTGKTALVKIWGERAEKLREHVAVGMKLLIRGRPEAKAFHKNDGTVAGELILHANDLEFLSGKPKPPQTEQLPLTTLPATKPKKRKSAAG